MADRWREIAKAERKLEEKAEKGLLKIEKSRLRLARERERLTRKSEHRAQRMEQQTHRRTEHLDRRRREAEEQRERNRVRRARRSRPDSDRSETSSRRRRPRRSRPQRTPQERAYLEARRRANAKIGFLTHGLTYCCVLLLILVSSRSFHATFIVAAAWGIGVAIHYFTAVVAPGLRERMVEDEVGRGVTRGVTRERQAAETRHERSLEDLSGAIAHEIRNPVTAAKTLVQQMGEDPGSGENLSNARVALEELDRVERSISHLLRYARDEEIRFEPFEMAEVIREAIEGFHERIDAHAVELELQIDTQGRMRGDRDQMQRVIANLLENALDALESTDQPVPRLQVTSGENLAGSEVWVRVRDNGPGIRADVADKVFSPFFSSKEKGTGLGLAFAKKVVDAHAGTLELETAEGAGTELVMSFPKDAGGGA